MTADSLYRELILDHNSNPRNFYVMEDADVYLEGYNPLCGDRITLYLKYDDTGERIAKASFQGKGCAISMASASMMTEAVQGLSKDKALQLFEQFHDLITGKLPEEQAYDALGKLIAFSGLKRLPTRVKCASLAWHTLKNALLGKTSEKVSTE